MRAELAALFPKVVVGAELPDASLDEPLFAEESAFIERAVDKRKREFALGRACARRALAALGIDAQPLPAKPDRSVRWPLEAWGSITHTEGLCAAVAARREHVRGIGIDAESRGRVSEKLWSHIATEREISWFRAALSERDAADRATLLFSAKESFYKAQFCVSETFVGFHAVELSFETAHRFVVRLREDVGDAFAAGSTFDGRYVLLRDHVVTGLVLLRP